MRRLRNRIQTHKACAGGDRSRRLDDGPIDKRAGVVQEGHFGQRGAAPDRHAVSFDSCRIGRAKTIRVLRI
jgi:hypothetical protein